MTANSRVKVNLTLPPRVKDLAAAWAKSNSRDLSVLVEELLRNHLQEKGINADVPIEEFLKSLSMSASLKDSGKKDLHVSAEAKSEGMKKIKEAFGKKK